MRDHNGELTFGPRLPERITRLRFRVVYRGRKLTVTVTPDKAVYRLVDGEPLDIRHHGRQVTVDHEDLELEIPPGPDPEPGGQPKGCEPRRRARQ
jgi:alpha,alpha-trehalose phosphorylase